MQGARKCRSALGRCQTAPSGIIDWSDFSWVPPGAAAIGAIPRSRFHDVSGAGNSRDGNGEKAERRAAREVIAAYHQSQLRSLLDRVRTGFTQLDAGDIDEFDLDDLIHHYKKSAAELWKFCGSTGGQWLQAARALQYFRESGDEPDWWEAGASRHDRSDRSGTP
jgi:hypothetical protein